MSFAGAAKARIEWLEDIIRREMPAVDLNEGPRVVSYPEHVVSIETGDSASPSSPPRRQKRPAAADASNNLQTERAQSISMSLGMLSLNSDSSQKHYLGSSSGLLFADLIGASPSSETSADIATPISSQLDAGRAEVSSMHHAGLHSLLAKELPAREDASKLVSVYLQWIHPDFPVLERESLQSALNALYDALPFLPEGRPLPGGWPSTTPQFRWNGRIVDVQDPSNEVVPLSNVAFILFMVFNIGAIVQVRSRCYEHPPDRFYRTAKMFARDCFSEINLSSIQGEVLLMVHSMLTPGEMNLWTLLHIAWAHCVELGIHREPTSIEKDEEAEQEVKRRVFYTIYGLDRSISTIQGRPLGFRDETFDLRMPSRLGSDEALPEDEFPGTFDAAVTEYIRYQFLIDRVISEVKLLFYHLPKKTADSAWSIWPQHPSSHKERLESALYEICMAFTSNAFFSRTIHDQRTQIFLAKLTIKYHMSLILLHQPSQVIRQPASSALRTCFTSALTVLDSYQKLSDLRALHYGWREVQHIFAAGATVVYSFWTCEAVRREADAGGLSKRLRVATRLLTLGGEWWGSVKRGLDVFGAVADSTVQRVPLERGQAKAPRLSVDGSRKRHDVVETGLLGANEPPLESPLSSNRDPWVELYPETEPMDSLFAPEIDSFLANFDNAEFTWNFPLDDLDEHF